MEEFTLEEWEWPRHQERRFLIEPFQSECLGPIGIARATMCSVPCQQNPQQAWGPRGSSSEPVQWVFFRAEGSTHNCVLGHLFDRHISVVDFPEAEDIAALEREIRRHFGFGFGGVRYFNLPQSACHVGSRIACWENQRELTPFRLPPHLSAQPSASIFEWLNAQLAHSNSLVAEAFQWSHMEREECTKALFARVQKLGELHNLLQLIARAEPDFTENLQWRLGDMRPAEWQRRGISETNSTLQDLRTLDSPGYSALYKRLSVWAGLLRRTYPFAPRKETPSFPLHVLNAYQRHLAYVSITGRTTSPREQIEAGRALRAWVQLRATPAEKKILFGHLETSERFPLESWDWSRGRESRFEIKPRRSDCLAYYGLEEATLCAVPYQKDSQNSRSFDRYYTVLFRVETVATRAPDSTSASWWNFPSGSSDNIYRLGLGAFPRLAIRIFDTPRTPRALEKRLLQTPQEGLIPVRYFNLPEHAFFIHEDVGYFYRDLTGSKENYFRFPRELFHAPAADIVQWFYEQMNDRESELYFATHWKGAFGRDEEPPFAEALARYRRGEVTGDSPLQQMMTRIVHSEAEMTPGLGWALDSIDVLTFDYRPHSPSRVQSTAPMPDFSALRARLRTWGRILRRQFPHPYQDDTTLSTIPLCVLLSQRNLHLEPTAYGTVASAHERLETLLFLREWAQGKATPEEMEILFPSK